MTIEMPNWKRWELLVTAIVTDGPRIFEMSRAYKNVTSDRAAAMFEKHIAGQGWKLIN